MKVKLKCATCHIRFCLISLFLIFTTFNYSSWAQQKPMHSYIKLVRQSQIHVVQSAIDSSGTVVRY